MKLLVLALLAMALAGCADTDGPVDVRLTVDNQQASAQTFRLDVEGADGVLHTWGETVAAGDSFQDAVRLDVESIDGFVLHFEGGTSSRGMDGGCTTGSAVRIEVVLSDRPSLDMECDRGGVPFF